MAMELTRMLELAGGTVGLVYMVFGVQLLIWAWFPKTNWILTIANGIVLTFFGAAAAGLHFFKGPEMLRRNFGFLMVWTGRGFFFLVCGLYLTHALSGAGIWYTLALIASIVALVIGTVILGLRCMGKIEDDEKAPVRGPSRTMTRVDYLTGLASVGILVVALQVCIRSFHLGKAAGPAQIMQILAYLFILIFFGGLSLVSSICHSPFVDTFFGFLATGFSRGMFYVLMGVYMLAEFNRGSLSWLSITFSSISVAVGLFIMVVHFRSPGDSQAPLVGRDVLNAPA